MDKLRKLTGSKHWKLWCAVVWSAMTAVWTRNFLQMQSLIEKGIFSEHLGNQHLLTNGLLEGVSLFLAIVFWREWLLYDKKKQSQREEQ